jgi:hypothetical protein
LAKADATAWLRAVAEEVGSGAHLLMVEPEPADEQGLRAALRNGRSVHLYSYDATHGKTLSPCVGLSNSFWKMNSQKFAVAEGHATGLLSPTGVGSVLGAMGGERCWIT